MRLPVAIAFSQLTQFERAAPDGEAGHHEVPLAG